MDLTSFLIEYAAFLAKLISVIILVLGGIFVLIAAVSKNKESDSDDIQIKNINAQYDSMQLELNSKVLAPKALKKYLKQHKQKKKQQLDKDRKRVFVLNFDGDIKASAVESLRKEITAVLMIAAQKDEVLVLVESAGGTVHGYGLAASQLKRVRDHGITLTVAVDKVAASGGYMMACVAEKIIAAPFAILGSIGVLAQLPNFHRLLKKMDIDFEQITAGDYKRTLTLFGENTDQDREKLKAELEETHALFKDFVKLNRQQVDIDKIATGEHWYGKNALAVNLVDELLTSDAYLLKAADQADLFAVYYERKKTLTEKLFAFLSHKLNFS